MPKYNFRDVIMKDHILNNIFDSLGHFPMVYRSVHQEIFKVALDSIREENFSRYHLEIMSVLEREGTLYVSEIGEILQIARPQMTRLIDELIDLGMVERNMDIEDRRRINITLTDKGSTTFKKVRGIIRGSISAKLSGLKDEDLEELSVALRKIADIALKL